MIEPFSEDYPPSDAPITAEPPSGSTPDVAFVIPASAYDSIDTDDELTRSDDFHPASFPVATPDLGPALKAIEELGQSLDARLDALATRFDREIRAEATREKVVDRLHAELQEYKQDLLLGVLRPVFVDLIQLHDDVGKNASSLREDDGVGSLLSRCQDLLSGIQQGIEDILYRQGVEPFTTETDAFDARRQRAVSTVPSEDPTLARKVAGRHRKGFQSGTRVIRPEVVSVYVHRPGSAETP